MNESSTDNDFSVPPDIDWPDLPEAESTRVSTTSSESAGVPADRPGVAELPEGADVQEPTNPFSVFVRLGIGLSIRELVSAEAKRFAESYVPKHPETEWAELVREANSNRDRIIRRAMQPGYTWPLVNEALGKLRESKVSEPEWERAKFELYAAVDALYSAAREGYDANVARFPEVTQVWPRTFTPASLREPHAPFPPQKERCKPDESVNLISGSAATELRRRFIFIASGLKSTSELETFSDALTEAARSVVALAPPQHPDGTSTYVSDILSTLFYVWQDVAYRDHPGEGFWVSHGYQISWEKGHPERGRLGHVPGEAAERCLDVLEHTFAQATGQALNGRFDPYDDEEFDNYEPEIVERARELNDFLDEWTSTSARSGADGEEDVPDEERPSNDEEDDPF